VKALTRRVSLVTASSSLFISLLFISFFPSFEEVFLFLFFSLLVLVLSFRVFGRLLLYSILTPAVYVISTFFVFVKFPLLNVPFKIILAAIFTVFYYYSLLSVNTILVSFIERKDFPLIRVGKTLIYITTLVTAFLAFTIIYKFEYIFLFYLISVFLVSFGLGLNYFWSQKTEGKYLFESFIIAILVTEVAVALTFFPAEAFFRALFASSVFYILIGIVENIFLHRGSVRIYLEYALIFTVVLVLLVLG